MLPVVTSLYTSTEACWPAWFVCNILKKWEETESGLASWGIWSCRSPDWPWGSAVERALVEREWRREAARETKGGQHPDQRVSGANTQTEAIFTLLGWASCNTGFSTSSWAQWAPRQSWKRQFLSSPLEARSELIAIILKCPTLKKEKTKQNNVTIITWRPNQFFVYL